MAKQEFRLLSADNKRKIRKEAERGRKKITICGRQFTIRKLSRKVRYTRSLLNEDGTAAPATEVTRTEKWLVVQPVRGLTPVAHIEATKDGNVRSRS